MQRSRLKIDTSVATTIEPPRGTSPLHERNRTPGSILSKPSSGNTSPTRLRTLSAASSTSSFSIVSPSSSSTNASTSSLHFSNAGNENSSSSSFQATSYPLRSPTSPEFDETVRVVSEYVLAMHDFAPQQQNATCLSFRAGQVIRVLNRDTSGWWDGELEGRRGWFPSNYVNAEVDVMGSFQDDESSRIPRRRHGHRRTSSTISVQTWANTPSPSQVAFTRSDHRRSTNLGPEVDAYCPPLMIPLLQGLQLLQNAVRANRLTHFQPSTACIISCVRAVLSETDCLPREAPLLTRYPLLSQERKRILSGLASLVAQAKKASDESGGAEFDDSRDLEIEAMLRLSGQVFAHVRRFLAVAVQCGVELPQQRQSIGSGYGSTVTDGLRTQDGSNMSSTQPYGRDSPIQIHSASVVDHGMALRAHNRESTERPLSAFRAKSMGDLRQQRRMDSMDDSDALPLLPHRTLMSKAKEEQYQRVLGHKPAMLSVSSTTSSSSSFSSLESVGAPATPPFPAGPSTTAQVMEALRHTHDNYLSTIAAFIGHAHSHSRTSHASSTGHMYDLVREVVEMVCKLLTIVEAVTRHPDVPPQKLGNLQSAKEGLYSVTSALAESVRLLTLNVPTTTSEEEEKASLLRSATGALKAGADCVAAVKMCLNRSIGEGSFVIQLPALGEPGLEPSRFVKSALWTSPSMGNLRGVYGYVGEEDEDLTVQAEGQVPSPVRTVTDEHKLSFDGSDLSDGSKEALRRSSELNGMAPASRSQVPPQDDHEPPSPTASFTRIDEDETTWEGESQRHQRRVSRLEEKIVNGHLPTVPHEPPPELVRMNSNSSPLSFVLAHDYASDEVTFNSEGHLVGATLRVLVEKMTPHDSIVDPAFASVFYLTFRLFTSPSELVEVLKARYDLSTPINMSSADRQIWEQTKGTPVRLRVTNFVKMWLEMYWRPATDSAVLGALMTFTKETVAVTFVAPAQRILELIHMRMNTPDSVVSPKGDRSRDPGMSINPPSAPPSEIPRPSMTKTLLAALRSKTFSSISITDFDPLELARQLTIMECDLYCAIQPEEVLETGQEGVKPPVNVRAVSGFSTIITGWVAESILDEPDIKRRLALIKFFIKVADRATSMNNFSTSRSILAALDSSTISRLRQTWSGLPQKNRSQLESLRKLADHGRNYYEYRTRLRNTAPPAVPFLGLYLTDVTFCREGNPSHRAGPGHSQKKLLNFNKYHKLARIVQDMQRFQKPYNLKAIPEVQAYLNVAFENSKHHGDLQDLYRRSLLVEPRQPADPPPTGDMRHLFSWTARSQREQTST